MINPFRVRTEDSLALRHAQRTLRTQQVRPDLIAQPQVAAARAVVAKFQVAHDQRTDFTVATGLAFAPPNSVPIPGFRYQVITLEGEVFSLRRHKLHSTHQDKGHTYINLDNKTYRLARLLALAFLPNPMGHRFVDYIDGDPANLAVSNLHWVARTEAHKAKAVAQVRPATLKRRARKAEWNAQQKARAQAAKDKDKAYGEDLKAKLNAMNLVDPEIAWANKCAREG